MGNAHSRAFALLGLLRKSPRPLGLTAIAHELNIATSSAHAILTELREVEAVTIDSDKRYSLGPRVFYLGSAYVTSSAIYRTVWPELVSLAVDLGTSAAMAVPWDQHHLIVAVHHMGPGAALKPGSRIPLNGGSYGKAYYAWSDAELPSELPAYTRYSISDPGKFAEAVKTARHQGYATDDEEFAPGVSAVASGVTSGTGYEGLLALWTAPAQHLKESIGFEKAGIRLAGVADRASTVLGDSGRDRVWLHSS